MNLLAVVSWWAEMSLSLTAGVAIGVLLWRWRLKGEEKSIEFRCKRLLETAQHESEARVREARVAGNEEAVKSRRETETAFAQQRSMLDEWEQRLNQREQLVNTQFQGLGEREHALREQQVEVQQQRKDLETERVACRELAARERDQLQQIAHLSEPEAKTLLLHEIEQEIHRDASDLSRHLMEEARVRAEEQARRIVTLAIQRYAGEHIFETTTATVALNGDDIKGRIIGREGRNIRAFEATTGVTVLIDDTPNAVVLSSFDPVRREIARQAMERLIQDGRIHPTRIEDMVQVVSAEMAETILKAGEDAVFRVGLPPLTSDLARLLGRLRFRYSFSQNILDHSIEVAHLTAVMAAELGFNVVAAKRAGLLHDIGKAVNHEVEGSHALIGADLVRRHGESEEVVNAVASHHDERPHTSPLGVLVSAADAISASRPGARSESMSTYLKRLEHLEQIGGSFAGVEKCYAVQAGRELRVIVCPDKVDDGHAYTLARNIARKIENDLQYPGQIRVTVVRETRCIEFAK